jgi:hypothetical protein
MMYFPDTASATDRGSDTSNRPATWPLVLENQPTRREPLKESAFEKQQYAGFPAFGNSGTSK